MLGPRSSFSSLIKYSSKPGITRFLKALMLFAALSVTKRTTLFSMPNLATISSYFSSNNEPEWLSQREEKHKTYALKSPSMIECTEDLKNI